jgi:hypothetical protein
MTGPVLGAAGGLEAFFTVPAIHRGKVGASSMSIDVADALSSKGSGE